MPADEVAKFTKYILLYRLGLIIVALVFVFAALRWAALPMVREIAGEDTAVDIGVTTNISIGFNVGLTLALVFSEASRRRLRRSSKDKTPPSLEGGRS